MRITKKINTKLKHPYAIGCLNVGKVKEFFAASQVIEKCIIFTN
jgi:hypothetical protein